VVLKPTDRLLLCCCCHLLAFITAERQSKKNGEKTSSFDDVTVFLLTIFSIKLLLLILRAIFGIEAHRQSFAPLLLPPARVHSSRAAKQKER
jgi:hypothetical protein